MLEEVLHVLIEGLKLLPFLFVSYLVIELIEHKSSKKMEETLKKSGIFGPLIGSILGLVPQCGFSVTASNLYAGRIISIGTLIAVFLSTSDEAIPIFISHPECIGKLLPVLLIKFFVALIIGTAIDFIYRKKHSLKEEIEELDEHIHDMCSHCHCNEKNILVSTLKHTFSTLLFILIVLFILHVGIEFIGEDRLSKVLMEGNIFQPFIASLIGLIPNCVSSVLLTELYIEGTVSFASLISGLLSGAGIGIAVLFRINQNQKENLKILCTVYGVGTITGIIIEFIQFLV